MMGVYFIEAKLSRLVKIGVTTDLHLRMKALFGANADDLNLLGFIPTNNLIKAKQVESKLHVQYRGLNHHGEWFKLSDIDITSIKEKNGIENFICAPPKNQSLKEISSYKPQRGSMIESIYCFIKNNNPTSINSITSSFGLCNSTVKQHVRELDKRGLVFYNRSDDCVSM